MGAHSDIGASSCERFWECPGSVALTRDLPSKRSFYAAQGSLAHQIADDILNQRGQWWELDGTGEYDGYTIPIDQDLLEAVDVYVDVVMVYFNRYKPCVLKTEISFNLYHLDFEAFGTCDAMIYVPGDRIIIVDYKHGAGVAVEIVGNKQTRYYALGAYYSLKKAERDAIKFIELIIVQPRCPHADGVVRKERFLVSELLDWEKDLYKAIRRVRDGDDTLKAGSHCKFCKAKSFCNEARNEVGRLAAVEFSTLNVLSTPTPPDPKSLTPDELAKLLPAIPFIKDWCDSLLHYAHDEAERGIQIPGYRLADRRANRRWKDEQAVVDAFEFELGDKIYGKPKLKSPAQLEKLLPKKRRHTLNAFWEKPTTGSTLVRVNSGRDTRLPSAISDFIDVEFDDDNEETE